ncbi:hypothetical protein [Ulvibacter antarcticus]|uniref:Uncharacterized protein n=1 Tax=Ulvibacter antarcticus TaxID=442714 RepID=A0A3L9Z7B4_9FLAO|nr:hypothetical protein [Ulvibacter antarcticus]RMA66165.1 hypothetical protein BXY75_0584 [Ulvibacter antarcticus]
MNTGHIISLFNLIEIFRQGAGKAIKKFNPLAHCEKSSLHDYYCDAERPFINQN